MSRISALPKLAPLAGAAFALTLSSCALPPEDACRMMRHEGLIGYASYEVGSRQIPPPPNAWEYRAPSIPYGPAFIGTGPTLTAPGVAGLGGFVRSPYTYPPRLVDVAGVAPGTVAICPYTKKPFLVPDYSAAVPESRHTVIVSK